MDLILEIINEDHLRPIGDFECDDEKALSDYLKTDAYDDYQSGEGVTYILTNQSRNQIFGYFTIRCNSLQAKKSCSKDIIIPCVEITKFAVHWDHRKKSIGTILMQEGIMNIIKAIGEKVGVKGIMLFSLEKSVSFYEKFGFRKFENDIQSDIVALTETYSEDCYGMFALLDESKQIAYNGD